MELGMFIEKNGDVSRSGIRLFFGVFSKCCEFLQVLADFGRRIFFAGRRIFFADFG